MSKSKAKANSGSGQDLYRTLFEKSADAILIIDGGRFVDCNQATVDMLRYKSKEELLQTHPSELSPEYQPDGKSSYSKADEMITIAHRTGNHRFEWEHKRADGEVFPVEVLLTAIPKQDGGQMLHVVWRDITERKQAEAALQTSEERFRGFADAAADWFWEMDEKLRFTYISGLYSELLGNSPEKVIGKSRRELYLEQNQDMETEKWLQHFDTLDAHQPFSEFEIDWFKPNGEKLLISISGNPFFDDKGQFKGYRGIGRDITERKRGEKEIRRLRNYLQNIIDSMPSMLIGVDGEGRVTLWNREAEEVTGLSAEQAEGKLFQELLPYYADEMQSIEKSIQSQQELIEPKRAFMRDNMQVYEDITIFPLVADGVEGAVMRIDDVTEQVKLEEMMIQSEKMLSVGGLAAGMAHEINNPLAGILQTTSVLSNRLTDSDIPANQRTAEEVGISMQQIQQYMQIRGVLPLLKTIGDSGRRVATIVENMLSFARKNDTHRQSENLPELIDRTVELAATDFDLSKHFDFKSISIERQFDKLPQVVCEPAKIQQVLLNLLRNGAQAMSESGQQAPKLILRAYLDAERDMVCIEVEDNGPGMDEIIRKRVFEPFFTTKSVGVGTGLGLSVSYFIVTENHGGEMSVESEVGKGARFIIRLPITPHAG